MGGHIFISYARRDGREYAEQLDNELQKAGFKTWRDTRDLDPHQDFSAELEKAIESSQRVVCCITPDVKRDDSFVRREIGYTLRLKKPIVPLIFQGTVPPIQIINVSEVDFTRQAWESGFSQLIDRLTRPDTSAKEVTILDDPYRDYLHTLYDQIVYYLNQTVFSLITLRGEETRDAVETPLRRNVLPMAFFATAGIESQQELHKAYGNFNEAAADFEGRVLLLGEPGGGKTTTLFAYARDSVAKRLEDPKQPLPILAPISTWDAQKQIILEEWLGQLIPALQRQDIRKLIDKGEALLLLDGLDELGAEREDENTREKFDPRMRFIQTIPSASRVIISCRIKDYQQIGSKVALKGAVTLQPLDDEQMQEYLHELPELWDALQTDEELREVARTPLLLSLFTFAYRESSVEELEQLRNIRNSPKDLQEKIFETFVVKSYQRELRRPNSVVNLTLSQIEEKLGKFAVYSVVDKDILDKLYGWHLLYELDSYIQHLGITMHILVDTVKGVKFIHNLILEYYIRRYAIPYFEQKPIEEDEATMLFCIIALRAIDPISTLEFMLRNPVRMDKYKEVIYRFEWVHSNQIDKFNKIIENEEIRLELLSQKDPRIISGLLSALPIEHLETQYVLKALRHPVALVRAAAVLRLSDFKNASFFPNIALLLEDAAPIVRGSAIEALETLNDRRAIQPLIEILQDEDADVRGTAALTLGKFRATESVEHLIRLLKDSSECTFLVPSVGVAARRALEMIGTPEALAAIESGK